MNIHLTSNSETLKTLTFGHFRPLDPSCPFLGNKRIFSKNHTVSFQILQLCTIMHWKKDWKKTKEWLPRKTLNHLMDRWTNGLTDNNHFIGPSIYRVLLSVELTMIN